MRRSDYPSRQLRAFQKCATAKKGKAMSLPKSMSGSLAAMLGAGALFVSVAASQAAMAPMAPHATPNIHKADCAVGMHIGPLGGCILGVDNDQPVVEHRSADDNDGGCTTKTIKRTDNMGNSETKTKSDC
jgi:hypothetical protein